MNTQLKFQKALDQVSEVANVLVGNAQQEFKAKSEAFINEIQDSRYIKVPIVGVFSAGKSSMLNVFTQKPGMLPVDTDPETAVAYELYYGSQECVELYRENKKIDTKPLGDIKLLPTQPGDIAKVYCTSEPIKELQERGIILVDMPGIGSGIERHDAAIFNYIHSGTAFLLLVDAEQGSLRGSTLAFMNELSRYDKFPAVLVSKIDKKPEKDIRDIVEYIEYQLTSKLGNNHPFVSTVCSANQDLSGLNKYFDQLDPDTLINEKLGNHLKLIINSVRNQIKTRIDLRSKDIANVDEKLKQIEEEIANVKAELPTDGSDADTPEESANDVLENVKAALEAQSYDIAQMIIDKQPEDSIKSFIVSIVRAEIITSLKEESEQYSEALGQTVQESIQDIATIEVDSDFLGDFTDLYNAVYAYIESFLNAGGIWGVIAKYILPFLPQVLNWLFGKSEDEVLEEVREKVLSKCVAPITTGLKPTVLKLTIDNQKKIQQKMQEELVAKMEMVKEGLREKMADANKSKETVSAELVLLNEALAKLNAIEEGI